MNTMKTLSFIFLLFVIASCNSETITKNSMTVKEGRTIAKEYNLPKDMVIFPEEKDSSKELDITEKQLREKLSLLEKISQTKEGKIARRLGKFYETHKNPKESQIDSLNKAIDTEFETNLYNERKAFIELRSKIKENNIANEKDRINLIKAIDKKYKTNFYK